MSGRRMSVRTSVRDKEDSLSATPRGLARKGLSQEAVGLRNCLLRKCRLRPVRMGSGASGVDAPRESRRNPAGQSGLSCGRRWQIRRLPARRRFQESLRGFRRPGRLPQGKAGDASDSQFPVDWFARCSCLAVRLHPASNRNTVVCRYSSPGRSRQEGKSGCDGVSG